MLDGSTLVLIPFMYCDLTDRADEVAELHPSTHSLIYCNEVAVRGEAVAVSPVN